MPQEPILTEKQLIDSIFENRANRITLLGIKEYFRRNSEEYSLRTTFVINSMLVGTDILYHEEKGGIAKKKTT